MDKTAFPTFLISSRDTDLAESIAFTRQAEEYCFGARDRLNEALELINRWQGAIHSIMHDLEDGYSAKASLALLDDYDISAFKRYCYIAGKLHILSKKDFQWAYNGINVRHFFSILMSDSPELLNYLIVHRDEIVDIETSYYRKDLRPFFNANTLLAVSGEFDLLKERALTFLNDERKLKSDKIAMPDHQFYVGLAERNIEKMRSALSILLIPKYAKRSVYHTAVHFEYYLQLQVLMYAKIAMIHGFDLGIDSPIAPRELIEINPLDKYEDPHDFMKEFDYNKPHQAWVEMWKARMDEYDRRQEAEKNRPFWKKLFG
ncbi:hypothetical protein E4T80_12485 [Muribacter muris]|uniref:Uncharacterized protein n=1 Tax=Muribacter muris TaxID=67855 RepID=A0A4Y9JQR6_9PAST|nr:Imm49 family immunity protein [Muribacter muris]MBF0786276.1 immunity 49 family protein [Muribacter muris]MBF0827321.1 immunity 49 family protein [Muribacter muris]TFV07229.1 hypothetical protein E4T80_12485 [Muribacter muris]